MTNWVGTPGKDSIAIAGPRPWVDVRAHGATGDGVTNDRDAFQAAIDVAAALSGRGLVVVPPPTGASYFIDVRTILLKTNVRILGLGMPLLTFNAGTITNGILFAHFNDQQYVTVLDAALCGLRMENTSSTVVGRAFHVGAGDHIPQRLVVEDNECINCAVKVVEGDGHILRRNYVHDITVTSGGQPDVALGIQGTTTDSRIEANRIMNVPGMGICLSVGERNRVEDNFLHNAGQSISSAFAIDTGADRDVVIKGNTITFTAGQNLGIQSEDAAGGFVSIIGNTVRGYSTALGAGIRVWRTSLAKGQPDEIAVLGNIVADVGGSGIEVSDEKSVHIAGNVLRNIGGNGIGVVKPLGGPSPNQTLVSGNTIIGWAAYSEYQAGISASVANAKVFGNYLDGLSQNLNRGISFLLSPGWIEHNVIRNTVAEKVFDIASGVVIFKNEGYATESSGSTSVADGGTINHGLATTPTKVRVTPTVAGEMASVTAVGATTFTVALKTHAGAAGTTQTVYWEAEV